MSGRGIPFVALLALCSCAVGPDYHRPQLPVPSAWHAQKTVASKPAQPDAWWQGFHDPLLNQLMLDALASNVDLRLALARIKDIRAQHAATMAAGLPTLTAKSTLSRRFNNSSGASQPGGSNSSGGLGVGNQVINIFQLGFDAQWELDFFGGVRRAIEAADATLDAEVESSRDVTVTLLGEVARIYIELRSNQCLLRITHKNLDAQQDTQHLTVVRQQSGLATQLEVAEADAQVAATQAQLPDYERAVQQAMYALSVLVGREPAALAARLETPGGIPVLASVAIPDLPSELLKRRPDIRHAERQMAIANAQIGIATAELYPKVNLAAFLGLQNMNITDFTPIGKSWSAASSLSMPIFNWGKLNANIKSKEAQSEQSYLAYQATILNAFKEVEDALITRVKEQQRNKAIVQQVAANRLAVELAEELYQKGLTGFINVLQNQHALYQAETNLAGSDAKLSTTQVALYKALGGGWQVAGKP
ncbi:MAG: efflux transporter outer membrane subunit [Methylococcales bacterium]|nr:efflux transporter outer membrane subunit [Methylococcales bacterium]